LAYPDQPEAKTAQLSSGSSSENPESGISGTVEAEFGAMTDEAELRVLTKTLGKVGIGFAENQIVVLDAQK
jgi:hypothetical protein